MDLPTRCAREILELHAFFVEWFSGTVAGTEAVLARFADALADDFHIVDPAARVLDRSTTIEMVRAGHGSGPTRIEIRSFEHRATIAGNTALVTYEEWIERGGAVRPLLATALLSDVPGAPNDLRWRHVHETWLPSPREPV